MGILRTDKISGLETPTPVTGSVEFDGSGDYLQTPDSEIFSLGTNDYTIEGWFYFTTLSATQRVFGQRASDASELQMMLETNASGELAYYFAISNSSKVLGGSVATQINTWHHIAVVRKNLVHTLYVDGVSVATNSTDTGTLNNRSQPFSIGRQGDYTSDAFNGHISNFRICKGTAVYTSDFTVPTHALEVTQDTVLLCCNNPDSVTASDHGTVGAAPPTLTANGDPTVSSINPGLTRDFTNGTEFNGVTTFDTQGYFVPPSGTTTQRGRGRGVFSAATSPNDTTSTNNIDYITIATSGNTQDFGDLDENRQATSGGSNSTRGLFSGGSSTVSPSGNRNTISYITIAATGNAVNFGDLSGLKRYTGSTSDKTRTVIAGGANAPGPLTDIIEYVTTQSLGDAQTFGDLSTATWAFAGTASSPTRGIYFGGSPSLSSSDSVNTIAYVTIQTLGDAQDFGDLTNVNAYTGPGGIVSSTTRGIRGGGGGANPFTRVNTIDYITMATLGNAQDFGDLSYSANGVMGCSSLTRGIFAGGKDTSPANVNTIDYITIASTGNAQDFGDMRGTYAFGSALSDCHGGIS